jgi:hypothetical protein
MVGVDQARQHDVAGKIEDFVRYFRQVVCRPYLLDEAIPNKKTTPRNLPAMAIHSDKNFGIANKERGHRISDR